MRRPELLGQSPIPGLLHTYRMGFPELHRFFCVLLLLLPAATHPISSARTAAPPLAAQGHINAKSPAAACPVHTTYSYSAFLYPFPLSPLRASCKSYAIPWNLPKKKTTALPLKKKEWHRICSAQRTDAPMYRYVMYYHRFTCLHEKSAYIHIIKPGCYNVSGPWYRHHTFAPTQPTQP